MTECILAHLMCKCMPITTEKILLLSRKDFRDSEQQKIVLLHLVCFLVNEQHTFIVGDQVAALLSKTKQIWVSFKNFRSHIFIYFWKFVLMVSYLKENEYFSMCLKMPFMFFAEKHKTYHIKDEQLNKDGFKKFMKHEHCTFENCRFSRVCNHIHCIRPGQIYLIEIKLYFEFCLCILKCLIDLFFCRLYICTAFKWSTLFS